MASNVAHAPQLRQRILRYLTKGRYIFPHLHSRSGHMGYWKSLVGDWGPDPEPTPEEIAEQFEEPENEDDHPLDDGTVSQEYDLADLEPEEDDDHAF